MPVQQGQPDDLNWDFDVSDVKVLETGGVAPGFIVNAPNTFTIQTTLQNQGGFSGALHGQAGTIAYRAEKLDDNTVTALASTAFTVDAVATPFTKDSALFSSGAGSDLDVGTYMLTVIVTMDDPGFNFVAGFNQALLRII